MYHAGFAGSQERIILENTHHLGDIDIAVRIDDDGMKRHEKRVFLGATFIAPLSKHFATDIEDGYPRHQFSDIDRLVFIDEDTGGKIEATPLG